jgi:aminomuconate-semialdehyde/2-hydroxymuconate-6-semialdehyde dehydrogenase
MGLLLSKIIQMQIQNFIGGKLLEPISQNFIPNFEPATGIEYGRVPDSDIRDLDLAVGAAQDAFIKWKKTPAEDKFRILNKISELLDEQNEFFAVAESRDQGKNIKQARAEIKRAAQNFRFFASSSIHFSSEAHQMEDGTLNYTLRQPLGIVGCISPWNLPLYLFTWKIAPALAAGNSVIAKPSEITPATAFLLSKVCIQAGLPPGVLNILHGIGSNIGKAIVEHPNIKAISFTGSTRAGSEIAAFAAPRFKKLSLELGGKNPNIVFADCDFDLAVRTSIEAAFQNQGEICLCGSRIYVEKQIYEKFKVEFLERAKSLKVGNPLDEELNLGAIASKAHYDKILGCISLAEDEGGKILLGGKPLNIDGEFANGWFLEPTVIEGLPAICRTNQEEIFGPVVTLQPFENEEEAICLANNCGYGLSATVFTQNLSKAHRVASKIESGLVWINCWLLRDLRTPFGGTKNSGTGREGGLEAMRFFTEPKNICVKL